MYRPQFFRCGRVNIRAILVEGEPWLFVEDVLRSLGLNTLACSALEDYESNLHVVEIRSDDFSEIWTVNVCGLYSLISQSKSTDAKWFRAWVTQNVLPYMRGTGLYQSAPSLPQDEIEVGADS